VEGAGWDGRTARSWRDGAHTVVVDDLGVQLEVRVIGLAPKASR
jgi:hypothetical protein